MFDDNFRARFFGKIKKGVTDQVCWRWLGARRRNRRTGQLEYGIFTIRGHHYGAHRVSYALHNGARSMDELSSHAFVCHGCDNPECCNPRHLTLGTAHSNQAEMVVRGRLSSGGAKPLRPEQVRDLRHMLTPDDLEDIKKVATAMAKFDSHEGTIRNVVLGVTYGWVTETTV